MAADVSRAKQVEMQEWLYGNQPTLTPATVQAAAERILGVKNFAAEYAKRLPRIRQDVSDGVALRIRATPTLFINGVRIPISDDQPPMPPQYFDLAVRLELRKATGK